MRSYTEVRLTLSIMTKMTTKSKIKTLAMMHLFYHLTNRKKKTTRVKMKMIKDEN